MPLQFILLIRNGTGDAKQPFISRNDSMWDFFEPELKRRLAEMEVDDTFSARVRSALVELLPGGQCTIDDVCSRLAISKRTLQRKLAEEDTTFQKQLNHTRELLAKNYIDHTNLPSEEIAFLLGYQDTNSFFGRFLCEQVKILQNIGRNGNTKRKNFFKNNIIMGCNMKAHKYWSMGALITMIGTFYTGYKGLKSSHRYFAIGSLVCMIIALYSGHKMISGKKKVKSIPESNGMEA